VGGVNENGGAQKGGAQEGGIYARTWVFLAAGARRAVAPARPLGHAGLHWRLLLLALSAAGSLASIVSLLTGHAALALRIFVATLLLLGALLLHALLYTCHS
jgi:hypothetical protein